MNSFFETLKSLGTVQPKPKVSYAATPAQNFVEAALSEIKAMMAGAKSGKWFTIKDGVYTITFRNGKRVVEINPGQTQFVTNSEAVAITALEKSIEACKLGLFDSTFAAQKTTRKTR